MSTLVTSELRKVLTLRFWWALALPPLFIALFTGAIYGTVAEGLDSLDSSDPVAAATILWRGRLTPEYRYLEAHLE